MRSDCECTSGNSSVGVVYFELVSRCEERLKCDEDEDEDDEPAVTCESDEKPESDCCETTCSNCVE